MGLRMLFSGWTSLYLLAALQAAALGEEGRGAAASEQGRGAAASEESAASPPAEKGTAYERSLLLVRSVLARRKEDPAVLHLLGDVHFRRGRFREAIASFAEASRRAPAFIEPRLGTAEAHVALEEYSLALQAFQAALAAAPDGAGRSRARRGLAEVHYLEGRYRQAAEELRAAIADGDESAEVRYLLGRALEAEARGVTAQGGNAVSLEDEALASLAESLRRNPAHAAAHYLTGAMERRRGRAEEARKSLESFRRFKAPKTALERSAFETAEAAFEARTATRLARILFESREAENALILIRHALQVEPGFLEARAYEGWIHFKLGKLDEATESYRAILAREPAHAEALWNLGKIFLARRDAAAAGPYLLKAMESRAHFSEGWELLTRLAQEGMLYPERAEEFARNALSVHPTAANYGKLAEILFAKGDLPGSERVLGEGIRRFPSDGDLRAGLEALRQAPRDGPRG